MKFKIIYDSGINIVASAIPIVLLQLVIFPILAKNIGDVQYGIVLTLISLSLLLSQPFGNVLNNIRLLENNSYNKINNNGDFNVLLLISILINSIFIVIGTIYYQGFHYPSIILMIMLSSLDLIRAYLIVTFRILLNYKAILINNVILGIGYLIGYLIFKVTDLWQLIYVLGSTFSLIHIIKNSSLVKEGFTLTKNFKQTTHKSISLFFSVLINSLMTYADRLLLFPLLGPSAVTVYYTSTIFGKVITRVITPISGVILSYITKIERMRIKDLFYLIGFMVIIGIGGYFLTIFLSKPLLYFLYPEWAKDSIQLIYITTATTIIGIMCSLLHPFILRFNNVNWQLFISGISLILYILLTLLLFNYWGLLGFSLGILITNIIKFIVMFSIFLRNFKTLETA
jgi:O-antigen/teichoic acid export membrane protein